MENKKLTIAVIGCGDRGMNVYAAMEEKYPDRLKVVACADINPAKRALMQKRHGITDENCFETGEELLAKEKLADALVIATLDRDHYKYAIPAMKKGYHLLLEKPVSPDLKECLEIAKVAKEYDRKVVVCHVLRYTAFYRKIKEFLDEKIIGDVVTIQAIEPVAYWHQGHSFVRGNWRNSDETSPMILQKCCHDLDIFVWLTDKSVKSVSSFGSLHEFKPEKAPEGASKYCLDGCPYIDTCLYSAKKQYLAQIESGDDKWPVNVVMTNPTVENVTEALKTGPYGRCIYHCDNNVVDHQVVNLLMDDGVTVNFTMTAFTKNMFRRLSIMGTKGEINADMEDNIIRVQRFGIEEDIKIDVNTLTDDLSGHQGGDTALMSDFIDLILDNKVAPGITSVDVSLESHYAALAAEASRLDCGKVINLDEFKKSVSD